nr:hypothetical protein Iba_scaffold4978CG0030 [Ipomoea batatas]
MAVDDNSEDAETPFVVTVNRGIKQRHELRSVLAASTLVSRQGEKAELGLVPGSTLLSPLLQAALRQSLLPPSGGTVDSRVVILWT